MLVCHIWDWIVWWHKDTVKGLFVLGGVTMKFEYELDRIFLIWVTLKTLQLSGWKPISSIVAHYENTPIQIYRKFYLQKLKIFR